MSPPGRTTSADGQRARPHHPEGAGGRSTAWRTARSPRSRTAARTASRRSAWARSSAATASSAPITGWSTTPPAPACSIRTATRTFPSRARVKSYPVIEKHKAIWIWMGDKPADPAKVPDFSVLDNVPELHTTKRDCIMIKANVELIIDNLLDLSHTVLSARRHARQRRHGRIRHHRRAGRRRRDRRPPSPATPTPPGMNKLMWPQAPERVDKYTSIRWMAPSTLRLRDRHLHARRRARDRHRLSRHPPADAGDRPHHALFLHRGALQRADHRRRAQPRHPGEDRQDAPLRLRGAGRAGDRGAAAHHRRRRRPRSTR